MLKKELDFILYLIVLAFTAFLALFPRRLMLRIAEGCGVLLFFLDRRHRKVALTNIRIAFPDLPQDRACAIAKNSFKNMCRVIVELIFMPKIIKAGKIAEVITMENEEHHHFAAYKNRGGIYITAHYGVWEYLFHGNWLLRQPFVPLHVVVRPNDNPYLYKLLNMPRELLGSITVPKKHSIKALIKALKDKEYLGVLIDQNVCREEGVFVDFFGKKACATFGATLLALRTDAPVIPVFVFRNEGTDTYNIKFLPEIPLVRTGNSEEDIRLNTQNFISCVESVIRERPDDWLWVHKRWKTRPVGEEEKIY